MGNEERVSVFRDLGHQVPAAVAAVLSFGSLPHISLDFRGFRRKAAFAKLTHRLHSFEGLGFKAQGCGFRASGLKYRRFRFRASGPKCLGTQATEFWGYRGTYP